MKKNHTDITIVLDRSGSMQAVAEDTIGGFNRFLDEQKRAPGTAALTLYQFDDIFEAVHYEREITGITPLTRDSFIPRGSTALLDAIGYAVTRTGMRLAGMHEDYRAAKVVLVILTDGQENASKEYTRARVDEMLRHQREVYSWEIVFLGANQDAMAEAAKLGVLRVNSMTYAHNGAGATAAFASLSSNLTAMRSCATTSMAFTPADYEAQEAAFAREVQK